MLYSVLHRSSQWSIKWGHHVIARGLCEANLSFATPDASRYSRLCTVFSSVSSFTLLVLTPATVAGTEARLAFEIPSCTPHSTPLTPDVLQCRFAIVDDPCGFF